MSSGLYLVPVGYSRRVKDTNAGTSKHGQCFRDLLRFLRPKFMTNEDDQITHIFY